MKIRPAVEEDTEYIVKIGSKYFPYIKDPAGFFRERLKRGKMFVAEIGGRVVGFVDISIHGDEARIEGIAVENEWQGLGIGTALLSTAIKYLTEMGVKRAKLMTISSNTRAMHLYEKLGFEKERKEGMFVWFIKKLG